MTIFGRRLSEYFAFCRVFLILILGLGIVRLALSLSGAPNSTARWFSMTAAIWIGIVYCSIRMHTSGFGSYKQLLPVVAILNLAAQSIAAAAIAIAIFSGTDNIFSAPEFAFGADGQTWLHLGAHLLFGTTVGSLVPWLIGSGILAISRKLSGGKQKTMSAA